jgi:CheY-like chemotaxis protein
VKYKLLVVDDHWPLLEVVRESLELSGYETHIARDGKEALKLFDSKRFDMIFLDVMMPIKDGWATLQKLRTVNPLIPIIVITGQPDLKTKAQELGATDLLKKPFTPKQILSFVEKHLPAKPSKKA